MVPTYPHKSRLGAFPPAFPPVAVPDGGGCGRRPARDRYSESVPLRTRRGGAWREWRPNTSVGSGARGFLGRRPVVQISVGCEPPLPEEQRGRAMGYPEHVVREPWSRELRRLRGPLSQLCSADRRTASGEAHQPRAEAAAVHPCVLEKNVTRLVRWPWTGCSCVHLRGGPASSPSWD